MLHTGDTWFNGVYPFIDYSSGGNINGMIKAADWNLAKSGPETIIIPGHGPVGDRKQLQEYRDVLVMSRDRVAALKAQGKTVEEVDCGKAYSGDGREVRRRFDQARCFCRACLPGSLGNG